MKKMYTLFFCLIITHWALSHTYYISNNAGNDLNNGTIDYPLKTLTKVNATLFNAGDSVLFKRGEQWNGQLIISSSGNSVDPIFCGAYGTGSKPKIDGTGYSSTLNIPDREFIVVSSFEIISGIHGVLIIGGFSTGLIVLNELLVHYPSSNNCISIKERQNVTISYSEIKNSVNGGGISAYNSVGLGGGWSTLLCHNITITHCYIHHNNSNGIYIAGHNAVISDNIIDNNGAFGMVPTFHNIYLVGDNGFVKNNILTNSPGGNGFRYEGSNLQISCNFIKNNEGHGISLSNDFPDTLKNNHIFYNLIIGGSNNYGVFTYSSGTGLFDSIYIYNNSICGTTTNFTGLGLFNGSNIFLKNNIIMVKDKSLRISALCANTLESDNNCFYSERIDQFHMYNPYGGPTDISLITWQTSGDDLHSIEANPLFTISPPDTTTDFKLTSSSTCINSGTPLGLSSDFFEETIINPPDIGACEYTLPGYIKCNSDKHSFIIFPNPNTESLAIHFSDNTAYDYLKILDISGKEIFMQEINSEIISIDTNFLTQGIYIICIMGFDGNILTEKFVKR